MHERRDDDGAALAPDEHRRSSSVDPSCAPSANHPRRSITRVASGASSSSPRAQPSADLS